MLSVVVPAYNVENTIKRCIRSIQANQYAPMEIIIVNDGSRDRTGEVCDMLAQDDQRIRVIHKENGGVGTARNAGLELARGNYITFVDADDEVAQNMYMRLMQTAQLEDADIVVCNIEILAYSGTELAHHSYEDRVISGNRNVYEQIIIPMTVTHSPDPALLPSVCNKIYKVRNLRDRNIRFAHILRAEDWIFNIECFLHAECVAFIQDHLYRYYTTTPGSLTKTRNLNSYENEVWLEKRMAELFPERYSREDTLRGILGLQISEMQSYADSSGWKGFLKYADHIFQNEDMRIAYRVLDPLAKKYHFPRMCVSREWRFGYRLWGIWVAKAYFLKHSLRVPYRALKKIFR